MILKGIAIVLGSALLIVLGLVAFFSLTLIDERISEGEAHGFSIGSTKPEIFAAARALYADRDTWIRDPSGGQRVGPKVPFEFSSAGLEKLEERATWKFFFSESYSDLIALQFDSGRLVEIWRYRLYMELP